MCVGGGRVRMLATSDTTSRQTCQNVNSKRRLQRIQNVQEGKRHQKNRDIKFLSFQIYQHLSAFVFVPSVSYSREGIFKLLSLGVDSKELIPPAYVDLCQYDNPIPTRFLAPIECTKIPALTFVLYRQKLLAGK
jgi:hypothetical protein